MAFDPDKYLAEKAEMKIPRPPEQNSGGFDPDKYLAEKSGQAISGGNRTSGGMAALEGFGQGAAFGYLPQLQAAAEPVTDKLFGLLSGKSVDDERSYVERRDANIDRQALQEKEHPGMYMAGNVAGALATPVIGGTAASGAGILGRMGAGIGAGALTGAIQNPGDAQGEVNPIQAEERLKGAAIGAATGGIGQGALEGLSAARGLVSAGANKIRGAAEERAFKALGPYQRDVLKNKSKLKEIGRAALDEDILSPSWQKTANKAEEKLKVSGKELGETKNKIFDIAEKDAEKFSKAKVNNEDIARGLEEDLLSGRLAVGDEEGHAKLANLIERFKVRNGKSMSAREAEALREKVGKEIKWDRIPGTDIPDNEKFYRSLYTKLKEGVEGAADATAEQMGGKSKDTFLSQKKRYGLLSKAADMSEKRASKEFANRLLSPSDYGAGAAGLLLGASGGGDVGDRAATGIKYALLGSLGNKAARLMGNATAAKALDKVANMIDRNPLLSEKYGGLLLKTAKERPAQVGSLLTRISSKPEFKEKK